MRIAILGIGGVGGYLGAMLARKYQQVSGVEIIFLARGENEKVIREKGITLITPQEEFTAHPHLVTNNPANAGEFDFLVCTVKSYDLESSLGAYRSCITSRTVILPLLNGVDATERIQTLFPAAEVWEGCVYIIARLIEPGIVKESGNIHSFYFGSALASPEKLRCFLDILTDAGVEAYLPENIRAVTWEKFFFISPVASLTSYFDRPIGEILDDESCRNHLLQLLDELKAVTDAGGVGLPDDIIPKTLAKIEQMPKEATSSMHSDLKKGGRTEYRSLTEYIVAIGDAVNVPTPLYGRILAELKAKTGD